MEEVGGSHRQEPRQGRPAAPSREVERPGEERGAVRQPAGALEGAAGRRCCKTRLVPEHRRPED